MKEIKLVLPDGSDEGIAITAFGRTAVGTTKVITNVYVRAMLIEDNKKYFINPDDMEESNG